MTELNKEKKEFIDNALMIAERGFIGLIVLGLIPFATFLLGLSFIYILYGKESVLYGKESVGTEIGGFLLSIAIIFYYGMVVGIWVNKKLVVTGKLENILKLLGMSTFNNGGNGVNKKQFPIR